MEENENLAEQEKDTTAEKIEQLTKALNEERGKRKSLEQKIKDSEKEDEADIKDAEEEIRSVLKNSKSDFSDETIEDLMNAFGKTQAKNQVKAVKKEIEREIMELKRDSTYRDADEYGDDIRKLMKKGLSAEQAYWAVTGKDKLNSASSKDTKEEDKERAAEGYVGGAEVGGDKKPTYSSYETEIAHQIGRTAEEVKMRSGALTISQIKAANEKFKK